MPTVIVRSTNQRLVLRPQDMLGSGGEGSVFRASVAGVPKAVKVYHNLTARRADKLAALTVMATGFPSEVVSPQELVLDDYSHKPVGFTMRLLATGQQELETLANRKLRAQNGVTTLDVVDIYINLADVLRKLHARGVLVGDLNPFNEFYLNKLVSLIDADSFQFGSWPCEVATERCLNPRLYSVNLAQRPVFKDLDDWYAFNVLLFNSLLLVHPYGGAHRSLRTIPARALKHVSVFDPSVVYPTAAYSPQIVSDELLQVFDQVFTQGDVSEINEKLLLEYKADLVECSVCHTWFPNARKKCPACDAFNRRVQVLKTLVAGVKALELFAAQGSFVFFKLVGTTMYGIAIETGQAVLYTKKQLDISQRTVLFQAVKGARYDVFDDTLVVAASPYSSPSELQLFDVSQPIPRPIVQTVTDTYENRSAVFRGSADALYRTVGGVILRGRLQNNQLIDELAASSMEHQTWFDAASDSDREVVLGYFRVFDKYRWFLLYNGNYKLVQIADLEGCESMQNRSIRFSKSTVLILRRTRLSKVEYCRLDVVDLVDGQVISSRRVVVADNPHLANINSVAYHQGVLLAPGTTGLVAENASTGSKREYPETASFLASDSQLWPYDGGVLVVMGSHVIKLSLNR
jgi:hypothetical protein